MFCIFVRAFGASKENEHKKMENNLFTHLWKVQNIGIF